MCGRRLSSIGLTQLDPASGRVKLVIHAPILPPKEGYTETMNVLTDANSWLQQFGNPHAPYTPLTTGTKSETENAD